MRSAGCDWALLALPLLQVIAGADSKPVIPSQIRGLDPALFERYEASQGQFTCLDGSRTIPHSAINDDYCDCPDGSDEPGTSACENSSVRFYCKNEGHIPGSVRASRVNDGICDPECCDGSDEWATGVCENTCQQVGKEHRAKVEAETKTRKTGAKIRGTYVKWAAGEKKRLEDELRSKRAEVVEKEKLVEEARVSLDKVEAKSHEQIEKRKQSPLYTSLLTHRLALTRLRSKTSRLQSELDTLHGILEELSKGYNPNYQDMAVKAAVVGYEELTRPFDEAVEGDDAAATGSEDAEEIEDSELDELEKKDLEGLLMMDVDGETDSGEDEDLGLLYRIEEYIPDSLYIQYEMFRDQVIDWLIQLGLIGKSGQTESSKPSSSDSPHVSAARDRHQTLTKELNNLNSDIRKNEETLNKMSSGYGPDAEWKKLDGTCIDKVHGDYTYELCFFGRATQKSNKDHSSNFLGSFSGWNDTAPEGTFDHYTKQRYTNGAKCWNGPMRSAIVDLSCGTANELLSISEPEKCDYRFKATSPALCWPLDPAGGGGTAAAEGVKEEL